MLTFSHTQQLAEYFHRSARFYYAIIDLQGNFVYVNPLFDQQFNNLRENLYGKEITSVFPVTLREEIRKILQDPACTLQTDLYMIIAGGTQITRWELTANMNDGGIAETIQAIGFAAEHPVGKVAVPAQYGNSLSERYKAYEQSAEGLWMFETSEPVSTQALPGEILAYWKTNAVLAECNDNTARMYGFSKAGELLGMPLNQLIDFEAPFWIQYFRTFIENGFKIANIETKEFDRYGNTRYFLNNMEGVVEEGMLQRVWGTQQDISERKKAEEQLQQSELFYRNLFANSLDGILLSTEEGMITFASPSITPILGFASDEVIGKNVFDFAHPEDREFAFTAFRDEAAGDPKQKFISVRLLKKSGEWIWCIIRGHNLLPNPYIKGIVIYFYDDTLRKQTEAALIDSEKRSRYQANVLNNVTDVIITTAMDHVVTSWNRVIEKLSGISEKEAIGRTVMEILSGNFYPYTGEQVADIIFREGIWRGELSFTGRNGEAVYLLHTISILYNDERNRIGLLGVGRDITERKKAEAELQDSEQFYRSMSHYSFDGVIMADKTGKITYSGPSVKKIAGYEPADILGHNFFEFIHPDDIPVARDAFTRELNNQSRVDYVLLRLKHADGQWAWCSARGHNLFDTPGINATVIYFTNDTKRKEAEDKLRKSEENFRHLIYNLKQGVILQGRDGLMEICNQAALDMLGVTKEHLLGKTAFDPSWNVICEDGHHFTGAGDHPVPAVLQTKKPVRDLVMGVYRPDTGDRVWLLANVEPVLGTDGELLNVVWSFTDITEQKRLSKELWEQELQKQKLLAQATIDGQEKERLQVGKELHDNINQHLTITRLYLEVAMEKASGEMLGMINQSHRTLVNIIGEIRLLSQSLVPPTLGDLGLVESVQDLCDSLKIAHKFNIDFYSRHFSEEHLPENLKLMLFRITQEQVSNIVRHARANSIQIWLQSDAEYITLTISDDGRGFDPAHYKKGLGFTNISSRAGLFNGKVEIDAAPGKGCRLTVFIPLQPTNQPANSDSPESYRV